MKKILLLLLICPFFLACSSDDDNDGKKPEGEKTAVTDQNILGSWEYTENKLKHILQFNKHGIKSSYRKYANGELFRDRNFEFRIEGYTLYLDGGAIVNDIPMNETEIYKRGEKLYFNNMPFTPYTYE